MKQKIFFVGVLALSLFTITCGKSPDSLKLIQAQTVGNYTISVLSTSDNIMNGNHSFYIEVRNSFNKELIDAGTINVGSQMQMSGMPMSGETSAIKTDTPGRYHVKYNFSMSGTWILNVRMENGNGAKFSITVN